MIRTQISLTEDQVKRLRRIAHARQVSIAALIREAVDSLTSTEDPELLKARALNVIGAFRSDGAPVSERHDEYLVEAYRGIDTP